MSEALAVHPGALGMLMPLFLRVDAAARICDAGPTLRRLIGDAALGQPLGAVFHPVHPGVVAVAADLIGAVPLRLVLRGPAQTVFRGLAVPLGGPGAASGALINLSFGHRLVEALADHALSDTDFAPTDLAFELLYVLEANAALQAEAMKWSDRLRRARAQAMEQALTDPLTGLSNRRALDATLARMAVSDQPFGLIHIDLDHFKRINDTLGHAAGDAVLAEVGRRLRRAVRDHDTVARLGGDEFVVLLPGQRDRARVAQVAERILSDLARPLDLSGAGGGMAAAVSASLGVVVWDGEGGAAVEDLLVLADRALYRSKDAGRGRITYATPSAA